MSTGLCGSEPYIAPEQFLGKRKQGVAFHESILLIRWLCVNSLRRAFGRHLGLRHRLLLSPLPRDAVAGRTDDRLHVCRLRQCLQLYQRGYCGHSTYNCQPLAQTMPAFDSRHAGAQPQVKVDDRTNHGPSVDGKHRSLSYYGETQTRPCQRQVHPRVSC
jgi:hypothetical protein